MMKILLLLPLLLLQLPLLLLLILLITTTIIRITIITITTITLGALGKCKPSLSATGEHKPSLGEYNQRAQASVKATDRYKHLMARCLAALTAIFKMSTVIESHISSIKTRKISNAGAWQGLLSMDDFQMVMEASLSQRTSLVKFLRHYDQQFLSDRVRHCWCLAEVCSPRMISKIL